METEPHDAEPGKAYLDELAAVLLEIGSLPLVIPPVKLIGDPNDKPTNIKVRANVKAEFVASPKNTQPCVCLSKERPTQLAAARGLLQKLRSSDKGGYAVELAAATAAAEGAAGSSSSSLHSLNAFDRLLAGRVAHRTLTQAAEDAECAASKARDTEREATAARKAADGAGRSHTSSLSLSSASLSSGSTTGRGRRHHGPPTPTALKFRACCCCCC